jgi:hypothetical protein
MPTSQTFPAIDAWMARVGVFQMTIHKAHDIKVGKHPKLDSQLGMLGEGAKKLYWVLPPLYYNDFTMKEPYTIDQYAVCIDYPNGRIESKKRVYM